MTTVLAVIAMVFLIGIGVMILIKTFKTPIPTASQATETNGTSTIHGTEADRIGGFNNPITLSILVILVTMLVGGLYITFVGNYIIGACLTLVSGAVASIGFTKHSPEKPKEIGLITFWDKPLVIGNRYYTVAGDVFLLPFFPFNLKTIKITMDNTDKVFSGDDFLFQTEDGVYMPLEISITATPNAMDLIDYIQAGASMEKVFDQIREILYREAQHIIRDMEAEEAQREVRRLSRKLKESLLESGSFGIMIKKLQVVPTLPESYRKKKQAFVEEGLDRQAELKEYETMRIAAEALQLSSARQFIPNIDSLDLEERSRQIGLLVERKKIPSLEECLDKVKAMRLIRDGKAIRIDATGNTGTFVMSDAKFNLGGNK